MSKYPKGLPGMMMKDPVFKRAELKVLKAIPVKPHLQVKWASDIENKEGWSVQDGLKDAFSDGFRDGVAAFKKTTGEELEEWIDWNMEYPIYKVRIPKLGFKVWTLRVKHIAKWLKQRFNG